MKSDRPTAARGNAAVPSAARRSTAGSSPVAAVGFEEEAGACVAFVQRSANPFA